MQTLSPQVSLDGEHIFTVSELNFTVKGFLERQFGQVWVSGEISNLSQPASGHLYFSLKDAGGQIRCAFFKQRQSRFHLSLKNGMQVIVAAQLSIYPERGDYQLIVTQLFDSGLGRLQQEYEALKKKLSEAGLFDAQRKRPIPAFPKSIGVITSFTAAALQDVLTVLKRRFPAIVVRVYGCQVQGEEAPGQLINAITLANRDKTADVLLLTRGGGSLEDLWAFNNEQLAYAIYNSALPIVSAVGHEIDFTIADFVADKRAPTPSAAAEMLSPDQKEVLAKLSETESALTLSITQHIKWYRQQVSHAYKCLTDPRELVLQKAQHLDYLTQQLQQAMQTKLKQSCHTVSILEHRLKHPKAKLQEQNLTLKHLQSRLYRLAELRVQTAKHKLALHHAKLERCAPFNSIREAEHQIQALLLRLKSRVDQVVSTQQKNLGNLSGKLNALSPLSTLERGYALVQHNGHVITDVKDVPIKSEITVQLSQGKLICQVKDKQ